MSEQKRTPWIFWPFVAVWRLVTGILALTGRLVAALLGFVLMVVGIVVSLTIVGAVIGVPLVIFGFMLMLRSIF